jgi:hypothetical protein
MQEEYRSQVFSCHLVPGLCAIPRTGVCGVRPATSDPFSSHRRQLPWFQDGKTGVLSLDRWRVLTTSRPY